MCKGCARFLRERGHVIRAAAVIMSEKFSLAPGDLDDLEHSGICRVLEHKQKDPQIVERPNSYFHKLVKHLQIDSYRKQRRTTSLGDDEVREAEHHDSLARQHLGEFGAETQERRALVTQILESVEDDEERDALMSILHDESAEEFARRIGCKPDTARRRRMRAVRDVAARLKQGERT